MADPEAGQIAKWKPFYYRLPFLASLTAYIVTTVLFIVLGSISLGFQQSRNHWAASSCLVDAQSTGMNPSQCGSNDCYNRFFANWNVTYNNDVAKRNLSGFISLQVFCEHSLFTASFVLTSYSMTT
jgi:hypothetical protein